MKFSIIIPVYNTHKKYLKKCIELVLMQKNQYELLIINDGSTETETIEYLKSLSQLDSNYNVTIFNNTNKGVSFSRNLGILKSTGDYLLFLDSDDFLSENCLSIISEILNDQDIVFFKYNNFLDSENRLLENTDTFAYKELSNYDAIVSEIINPRNVTANVNYGTPWAKVFSRRFIKNNSLLFEENLPRTQDRVFLYDCVSISKNIGLFDFSGYVYNSNPNSICQKYNPNLFEKFNRVYLCMKERTISTTHYNMTKIMYINFFFEILEQDIFHRDNDISTLNRFIYAKKLYSKEYKNFIYETKNLNDLTNKKKMLIILCKYHLSFIIFIIYFLRSK